ncbi:hypothetical protein MIND_00863500 [Mycena indigotica]|uniref:C2H2-type domain-containing protein n=1 Tax=Mycena indigotica TaxID=2126181 RepID=A0A8H6SGW2_9AGAR|nr:uncharacterized protein MIND_00863500 [Mycena indigotica]KAF7299149.1 hypothetical protein MIND_00863500 [Mycena indigotica]
MPALRSASTSGSHACTFSGCTKRFSTSGHLARHVRVHTGEMAFACSFPGCKTRCSRQDNLRQHYRLHFDIRDPEALRRQAPHKKRRKTRVQRVLSYSDIPLVDNLPSPLSISEQSSSASSSSSRSSPYQVHLDLDESIYCHSPPSQPLLYAPDADPPATLFLSPPPPIHQLFPRLLTHLLVRVRPLFSTIARPLSAAIAPTLVFWKFAVWRVHLLIVTPVMCSAKACCYDYTRTISIHVFFVSSTIPKRDQAKLFSTSALSSPCSRFANVRKAAGLCSSAQNNNGVSSTIEYPIFGAHNCVRPIP